jgi:hypothetical protein
MNKANNGQGRAVTFLCGLIFGVGIGLAISWAGLPSSPENAGTPTLETIASDDWIVLTANTYALDHDLVRAQARLARLNELNINEHTVALAQTYAANNDPTAARLALLAVALGSNNSAIVRLAQTATPPPTSTATLAPTATNTATPTNTPSATLTRLPTATRPPTLAPVLLPQWTPAFPAGWPSGVRYEPITVAPGQKYWRLAKAIYCDTNDENDYCQDLPGGPLGTETYISLIGAGGWRESAPISVISSNGEILQLQEKSASDTCNCNYSFFSNGYIVQVLGAPSDKISGMSLYSVKARLANFHVRYFITFQLVTR